METTGLADPAPIVQLLLNNPLVSHFVRLDTVVTTVDAVNGIRQIDEHAEAVKQAALADRLLLTKADLAAGDEIEQLRRRLVALNPGASWHTVSHGEIAPDMLFGAALFDPARKTVDVQRWINESAYETQAHDHADHDHDHKGHAHGTDINAYCLTVEQPLSMGCLPLVAWPRAAASGRAFAARQRYPQLDRRERAGGNPRGPPHFPPSGATRAWPDADHRSRIVFITRGIDRADLEASFFEHVVRLARLMRPCARARSRLPANSGATLHVELVTHRAAGCRSS